MSKKLSDELAVTLERFRSEWAADWDWFDLSRHEARNLFSLIDAQAEEIKTAHKFLDSNNVSTHADGGPELCLRERIELRFCTLLDEIEDRDEQIERLRLERDVLALNWNGRGSNVTVAHDETGEVVEVVWPKYETPTDPITIMPKWAEGHDATDD